MQAVKTCDVSCCRRRYVLICRSSIASSTHGRVAGTSEAYENQASIHCGSRGTLSPAAAQETAASSDLLYTDTELIVKT